MVASTSAFANAATSDRLAPCVRNLATRSDEKRDPRFVVMALSLLLLVLREKSPPLRGENASCVGPDCQPKTASSSGFRTGSFRIKSASTALYIAVFAPI